ncbi:hypothetical protein EG328_010345 [Venturia inaequalis]|uniref:Uncharacterized protein n=1 Tax=Venturia inaequalis TaxID=5025 RepID=A0A8H3YL22_VENIN|nr:hypothetical protein EG328_010345 [Venturia inaequalis]
MPLDPRIPDAWEDAKSAGRKLSSAIRGSPEPDYIAEIRARLPTPERNMRVNAERYDRLSTHIQEGTRAAEILITNTQDVTPEMLDALPRTLPDAARVLSAGSRALEAVKEKSKVHRDELKKIEREAREEKRKRVDEDVEELARVRAEELAKPHAERLAREMTAKARKGIEESERGKFRQRLDSWKNDAIDSIEWQKERKWRDWASERKEEFTKEETQRIEKKDRAAWEDFEKRWKEWAEAEMKKEMQTFKDDYMAGDKRKRDDTEAELRVQVKNLTNKVDNQGREIKKLKTRIRSCQCSDSSDLDDDSDSDGDGSDDGGGNSGRGAGGEGKNPNGSGKPPDGGDKSPGPGGSGGNGGSPLSRAPPLSSGKSGRGGNGKKTPKKSPPTGPKRITDDRDKSPSGSGSQEPPSNPHSPGTKPSSGKGTAPAPNGSNPINHFDNAKKPPPGGWPEEKANRKPLSENPFDDDQARMLDQLRKNPTPAPDNGAKPTPKFGQPSIAPRPGQFGAPSNAPTNPAGTGGTAPAPGIFGAGSQTMNGGYNPANTGGNAPPNPT